MPSQEQTARRDDAEDLTGLPRAGEIFDGKYRILGPLGVGGMAVVLAAKHLRLDERVALKFLLPQWTEDPDVVDRFLREGRLASKIHGEHVVRVLDVGLAAGRAYLVMEYLDGSDLDALIAERGRLPIATAIDLLLQACEAIAEAHACGIIHRDLKPANLFLTHRADGSPCMKVLDFGISKALSPGSRISGLESRATLPTAVMGSPHYMPPEQMQSSKNVDARSDIWSLGAILHEMLSGKPPFVAESITALCARILTDPPPPLTGVRFDVSTGLEAVVLRCLDKDPARRFGNVAELARALSEFGTPAARASTETITRIIEGNTDPARWSPPRALRPAPAPQRASDLLEGIPRPPMRSLGGIVAVALVLLCVGGAVAWIATPHARAIGAAFANEAPTPVVATATAAPSQVATTSRPPPALPPIPPVTTAAVAPVATTSPVASAPRPLPAHHATRPGPAPWMRAFSVDSTPPAEVRPFAAAAAPPSAPPATGAPAPSAPPVNDPDALFEDRK